MRTVCLLWCKRSPWPTSRSLGERAEAWVGRKEQAGFPTGGSLVQPAPMMAPHAQMCPLHYTARLDHFHVSFKPHFPRIQMPKP